MSLLHRNILPWARRRVRRERDPRSISGLQLYTDAYSLQGSLGYLDSVASWPDWSGLNRTVEQSVGGSQPRFLPWSAAEGNYLHVPGVNANFASTPSIAALSGPSALDIKMLIAANDYTPSARYSLWGQYDGAGNQRSWLFQINTDGTFRFLMSADGTAGPLTDVSSSVASGISDGSKKWVRVTWETPSGDVKFYLSDNGNTWTQLGTTQSGRTSAPFASSAVVTVGGVSSVGGEPFAGRLFVGTVSNGIDGPVVARFDPNRANANSSSFVADTGETWTINRTAIANAAQIVSAPAVLFDGTDDFLNVTTGLDMLRNVPGATILLTFTPRNMASAQTWAAVGTAANATRALVGTTSDNLIRTGGGITETPAFLAGGALSAGNVVVGAGVLRYATNEGQNYINGALSGAAAVLDGAGNTSDTNSNRIRIGCASVATPVNHAVGAISNALVYNRALTDAEIRGASRFLARRARAGITIA
jgi:hypothetical protein